jgi:hypothetical protein
MKRAIIESWLSTPQIPALPINPADPSYASDSLGGPSHSPPGRAVVLVQVTKVTLNVARSPAGLTASHAASVARRRGVLGARWQTSSRNRTRTGGSHRLVAGAKGIRTDGSLFKLVAAVLRLLCIRFIVENIVSQP